MNQNALLLALLMVLAAPLGGGALLAQSPDQDQMAAEAPIKRFIRVDDGLYRGAQPDEAGFRHLREMGIQTVVSFRNDGSERALVESLGMRFVQIPVTFRPFGWGDDFDFEAVDQFFDVVDDPASGMIFFHCKRGADRTGTLAAIYRVARQGWDVDRAYDEARDRGMRWWYFQVKGQIEKFSEQLAPLGTAQ